MSPKLLLKQQVKERVLLSDASIWREEKAGRFPRRIKIGQKRVAWSEEEIDLWLRARMDARGEVNGPVAA
jgi:prophage regulatory protein